jgi:outer membrane protein assembly factor BamB
VAADLAGRRQIVSLTSARIIGANAADGKLLWELPFKTSYEQNIVTPLVVRDTLLFAGYHLPLRAFRFAADGDVVTAKRLWECEDVSMYMSSPVVVGGHLYGLGQGGGGRLVCVSLADGQRAWKSASKLGEYASLVAAGDKVLALHTDGELIVFAADPTVCRELARVALTKRSVWAHLAVTPTHLFVKDKTHLSCFPLPKP